MCINGTNTIALSFNNMVFKATTSKCVYLWIIHVKDYFSEI
ncbi:hypothetical protein BFO_3210 [Tannerella forsythia 92A2]|uniref:Uncharacterized protein n=1 Tax=Tannerella forsythia (strain ATCC 43037 / JCM 10827 / CCUG 21028 A / KCTC 5666 / FDC 338) TaxID=203275 RepID=G8UI47_TANFA|nr:hypothetical protein BFO_3210 [Tannerella forsythia 92A2]